MLIGIDGNEVNVRNRVGVNQYGFELLWAIHKLQDEWKDKHKIIVYLKEKPLSDLPKPSDNFVYKVLPGKSLWILRKLSPYLLFTKDKPDVFFSPSHYVPLFCPIPRACSIMDLGFLEFSAQLKKIDFWQLKLWSAYSILVSKAIIAISNSTKDDIVRHYHSALKKTFVTLLACDKNKFNTFIRNEDVRRIKKKYSIVDDYVLFLSTLKPSKNVEGLLEAFSYLTRGKDQLKTLKLVIAGKKGWLYQSIFEKVKELSLKERVIFTDFIPEEDKPGLIAGSKVFVLPSFWEGFGLDILNAMACGIPVVVSKRGSLPEVAGDAGIFVNPKDFKSIAKGLEKVLLASEKEYNIYKEKCLSQVKKFSWEETARKTINIIENINTKK